MFQLPVTVPSRGPISLFRVCIAVARTVWFSFHLVCHRSAASLSSLNISPLTQTLALLWGLDPCFISQPTEGRSSLNNTPIFPPCSYILPSFTCFYIFFSFGQVLLSALKWCLACTSVWRCIPHVSTSTYYSAILFKLKDPHDEGERGEGKFKKWRLWHPVTLLYDK